MKEIEKHVEETIKYLFELKKHNNKLKIDNWFGDSKYLLIKEMSNDDTGEIGELLMEKIFKEHCFHVEFEKAMTSVDKDWDIIIAKDKKRKFKIEVKTATIGKTSNTFQHEKFFRNREYDIVTFLDFTANDLYCIFAWKKDILWSTLTKRKVNGKFTSEYKFDFSLKNIKDKKIKKFKKAYISKIETDKDLIDLFTKMIDELVN